MKIQILPILLAVTTLSCTNDERQCDERIERARTELGRLGNTWSEWYDVGPLPASKAGRPACQPDPSRPPPRESCLLANVVIKPGRLTMDSISIEWRSELDLREKLDSSFREQVEDEYARWQRLVGQPGKKHPIGIWALPDVDARALAAIVSDFAFALPGKLEVGLLVENPEVAPPPMPEKTPEWVRELLGRVEATSSWKQRRELLTPAFKRAIGSCEAMQRDLTMVLAQDPGRFAQPSLALTMETPWQRISKCGCSAIDLDAVVSLWFWGSVRKHGRIDVMPLDPQRLSVDVEGLPDGAPVRELVRLLGEPT